MLGPNRLLLRENLEVGNSLPPVRGCAASGVYGESVAQPFLPMLTMWVFTHLPDLWESAASF